MNKHAPMLAAPLDLSKIKYPVYVSPKVDGVRCKVVGGKPLSRKLKVIPNKHIQQEFAKWPKLNGFDGELIVGEPYGEGVFARTTSAVMSHEGQPLFNYYAFDYDSSGGFNQRYMQRRPAVFPHPVWFHFLTQYLVNDKEQLLSMEKRFLNTGFEGLIARSVDGIYKHGRSTVNEGLLLKLVRFATDEAVIVDFKEQMHNENPAEKDNLGHTKRSSKKAGKRGAGILGSFVVEAENYQDSFEVGTGFTAAQRMDFWTHRKSLKGKIIRFKHKPIGAVDAPRHPVFQGFRNKIDL